MIDRDAVELADPPGGTGLLPLRAFANEIAFDLLGGDQELVRLVRAYAGVRSQEDGRRAFLTRWATR